MTFLMGLNDSFAQVRSQILLLDTRLPINRVFSLVIQEERQRAIGVQSTGLVPTGGMAFSIETDQSQTQTKARGPPRMQRERTLYMLIITHRLNKNI